MPGRHRRRILRKIPVPQGERGWFDDFLAELDRFRALPARLSAEAAEDWAEFAVIAEEIALELGGPERCPLGLCRRQRGCASRAFRCLDVYRDSGEAAPPPPRETPQADAEAVAALARALSALSSGEDETASRTE